MFYENLLKLCSSHGVKVTNVVTELGCSQGEYVALEKGRNTQCGNVKKIR